ncbi:MAG TPA: 60S ribosomal protein L22 [Candidatus Eisenbacteria bacterium]|nr:60S ribosomal protein L22 [Candidatus Eisenbacteria bacterium]
MTETKIDISELKDEGGDLLKELATYLKEKTNAKIETGTTELILKSEDPNVPRTYLRVLLKKFIHKKELKEHYRIISGKENTLVIKGKKVSEEE